MFSALTATAEYRWHRIAMPLIGAGSGGLSRAQASEVIERAIVDWAVSARSSAPTCAAQQGMTVRLITLPSKRLRREQTARRGRGLDRLILSAGLA